MLVSVFIRPHASGGFTATAPDFAACTLADADEGNAFARMRLAIEGALADTLLAGGPLPTVRPQSIWRTEPRFSHGRWYEVHMNLGHIEAVARHQRGRRKKPATHAPVPQPITARHKASDQDR